MALDALFAADLRGASAIELLEQAAENQANRQNQGEIVGFAKELVEGVLANQAIIDDQIGASSHQWSLDRMPAVDRSLLRLGAWEILFSHEVPDAVAISEAVEMAKELSTEESAKFVNGILAAIAATKSAR